jgi:hypothetical protein
VTPCSYCKNQRFGGRYRLHHQGGKNQRPTNNVSSNSVKILQSWEAVVRGEAVMLRSPWSKVLDKLIIAQLLNIFSVLRCAPRRINPFHT